MREGGTNLIFTAQLKARFFGSQAFYSVEEEKGKVEFQFSVEKKPEETVSMNLS